ncbi:MAG TPA: hypothetical protein VE991_06080 [Acidimicrobiales bacterium]|nr:hypothetical protein [Acidimicrobiales bacterium]
MSGPGSDAPEVSSIVPPPSDEETIAILAAIDQLWPRPVTRPDTGPTTPVWRFSGRWWARPLAVRRERPYLGGAR